VGMQSLRLKILEAIGTWRGIVSLVAAATLASVVACSSSSGSTLPCCLLGSPDADLGGENCQCPTGDSGSGTDNVSCVINAGASGTCSIVCTQTTQGGTSTTTLPGGHQVASCPN
jgi:hypothetical protein